MKDYLTEMTDVYARMAIGNHIHAPINLIFQGVDETHAAGIFQFQASAELIKRLTANANLHSNHVLWMGDAFFRPKAIVQSPHLMGNGIGNIYTTGFVHMEEWASRGKILKGDIMPEPIPHHKKKYAPE